MVKDVVKSKYRMIDMWSSVWGGSSTRKSLRRQRRKTQSVDKKHTNRYMWSRTQNEMMIMWSCWFHKITKAKPRLESNCYEAWFLGRSYCNSCLMYCQVLFRLIMAVVIVRARVWRFQIIVNICRIIAFKVFSYQTPFARFDFL